jgi:hypothetical protein
MSDLILQRVDFFFRVLIFTIDDFLAGEFGVLEDHSGAALAHSDYIWALNSQMHHELSLVSERGIALTISGTRNLYLRMLADVLRSLFIVDILFTFWAVESQLINCPAF